MKLHGQAPISLCFKDFVASKTGRAVHLATNRAASFLRTETQSSLSPDRCHITNMTCYFSDAWDDPKTVCWIVPTVWTHVDASTSLRTLSEYKDLISLTSVINRVNGQIILLAPVCRTLTLADYDLEVGMHPSFQAETITLTNAELCKLGAQLSWSRRCTRRAKVDGSNPALSSFLIRVGACNSPVT